MNKHQKVLVLLSKMFLHQDKLKALPLEDRWFILKYSKPTVELLAKAIPERANLKEIRGWRKIEERKVIKNTLKIPEIASTLVSFQREVERAMSDQDIDWAYRNYNSVIQLLIDIVRNKEHAAKKLGVSLFYNSFSSSFLHGYREGASSTVLE